MAYRYLCIALIGFLLMACTSNTIIKKPENLIPKDQMVDLITDLLLAQGGKNIRNLDLDRNTNYFPLVFEKYQIDSTQFQESNYYYTSKIDDYDEILIAVEGRLNSLKDEYNKERKILDSLRRYKIDSVQDSKRKPPVKRRNALEDDDDD